MSRRPSRDEHSPFPAASGTGGMTIAAIWIVGLTLLHIAGAFFHGPLTWGYHEFGYLPASAALAAVLLVIGALVWPRSAAAGRTLDALGGWMTDHPRRVLIAAAGTLAAAAWIARVHVPLLGDGFFIVKNFSDALRGTGQLLYRNEPLATVYYFAVESLFRPSTYSGFLDNFLIAGIVCGICYIVIILRLTPLLVSDAAGRAAVFLLFLALPVLQLFVGYVEVYGVVSAAVAFYCLAAVRYLRGEIAFTRLPLIWFAAVCFHLLCVLLLPSLLLLAWLEYRSRGFRSIAAGAVLTGAAVLVGLMLIDFDLSTVTATVPHSHFFSWGPATDPAERYAEAYAGVSLMHANDLLNYIVLMAGPVIALALISAGSRRASIAGNAGRMSLFCASAAVPVVLFLLAVKFDLGPAKDWDVLAPYLLPIVMLLVTVFVSAAGPARARILLTVALATGIQTSAYIVLNASTGPALKRYHALIDPRTMSNAACYAASHHLALYYHQVGDDAGAVALWRQYLKLFPADPRGYRNIAVNATPGNVSDELLMDSLNVRIRGVAPGDSAFRAAFSLFCRRTAALRESGGRLPEAIAWYRHALEAAPGDGASAMKAAQLFSITGKSDSAVVYYKYSALLGLAAARDSLARKTGR